MKKTARIAIVAGLAALALTACGERDTAGGGTDTTSGSPAPNTPTTSAAQIDFKACMVSDSGGFDDKSFNETSLRGQTNAAANLGVQVAQVESHSTAEFADNIASMVRQGCNEITTVGFLLGDDTLAAAKKNPDIDFAIVDFAYEGNTAPANLKGLVFDTKSASYLAGYVAAASSESGIVGTFGGLPIPTVTDFMEGFRLGVEKYNEDNGAEVQVLGWDGTDGQFTQDFEDAAKGQQVGEQLIQQGADVIFPVAGPAGLGGLAAAKAGNAKGIWVDSDGCQSTEYCDLLLTSVKKNMDVAVEAAIKDGVDDAFTNEVYTGTLANDGVALAELGPDVPADVAAKVEELKQGLIDGSITLE